MRRPSLTRRRLVACGMLAGVVAALTAGCGGAGTITIGDGGLAAPPAAASPVQAVDAVQVGPRPFRISVRRGGYAVTVRVSPNRASTRNRVVVTVARGGAPVTGAQASLAAGMLAMDMGVAHYALSGAGSYSARTPAWLMPGPWGLAFTITPPGHAPLQVVLQDQLRA